MRESNSACDKMPVPEMTCLPNSGMNIDHASYFSCGGIINSYRSPMFNVSEDESL